MSLLLMTFLPMFLFLLMTFLSTHKKKGKTMTKKERKPKKKLKKKNNSDYESRHRKRDNSPTKLAARRVVAANCQLQPHMELSWKEGRKEGRIWEKEAERWERRTERQKRRGEERSTRVKEDGGGQQRRRTDGRQLLISLVGWDFKYSDLPTVSLLLLFLNPSSFFYLCP
jgi:hypothetical protein